MYESGARSPLAPTEPQLGNPRETARLEQLAQPVEHERADARVPRRERDDARGHDRRGLELGQRRAHARAEHAEQVAHEVARCSSSIAFPTDAPTPVDTPYTDSPRASARADHRVLGVEPRPVLGRARRARAARAAREREQVLEGLRSRTDLVRFEAHARRCKQSATRALSCGAPPAGKESPHVSHQDRDPSRSRGSRSTVSSLGCARDEPAAQPAASLRQPRSRRRGEARAAKPRPQPRQRLARPRRPSAKPIPKGHPFAKIQEGMTDARGAEDPRRRRPAGTSTRPGRTASRSITAPIAGASDWLYKGKGSDRLLAQQLQRRAHGDRSALRSALRTSRFSEERRSFTVAGSAVICSRWSRGCSSRSRGSRGGFATGMRSLPRCGGSRPRGARSAPGSPSRPSGCGASGSRWSGCRCAQLSIRGQRRAMAPRAARDPPHVPARTRA